METTEKTIHRIPRYRVCLVKEDVDKSQYNRFSNSREIYLFARSLFQFGDREGMWALLLDSKNRLIGSSLISVGSLGATVVHPREALKPAVAMKVRHRRRNMPIHREVTTPKSPSSVRVVDMSPQLVTVLSGLMKAHRAACFAQGIAEPEWLFLSTKREKKKRVITTNPVDYSCFKRAFNRMQDKAGIRRRSPHDLRYVPSLIMF